MSKKFGRLLVFGIIALFFFTGPVHAATERPLESGSTYTHTLNGANAENWYRFDTTQDNSDIYIYLSNTSAPARFAIYDSNRNRINWSNNSYFTTRKAGTYYVRVYASSWGNNYSSGTYDITATYASGKVEHNAETFEPNDTRENAYSLTSGQKISSSLSSSLDVDFFEITTTEDNGDVNIYLSNTSAPARFTIYDSNKKRISSSNNSYFNTLKAGTYYIEVYPYSWGNQYTRGNYDLIATYSTPGETKHDAKTLEPNDTRENAFKLRSGQTISSNLSNVQDYDFYAITLDRPGNINVQLTDTTAPMYFTLHNENKRRLSSYNSSISTQLQPGTYYIEVYANNWRNSYSSGNYKLKASYPSSDSVSKIDMLLTLDSRNVTVNGKRHQLLSAPYIKNATTLVPIRLISEQLGADVQWNGSNQTVKLLLDGTTIDLRIGNRYATVNGRSSRLLQAPELKRGTTFVPVRFISENYGREVIWNAKNRTVRIK